jgi:hypothetical protein
MVGVRMIHRVGSACARRANCPEWRRWVPEHLPARHLLSRTAPWRNQQRTTVCQLTRSRSPPLPGRTWPCPAPSRQGANAGPVPVCAPRIMFSPQTDPAHGRPPLWAVTATCRGLRNARLELGALASCQTAQTDDSPRTTTPYRRASMAPWMSHRGIDAPSTPGLGSQSWCRRQQITWPGRRRRVSAAG